MFVSDPRQLTTALAVASCVSPVFFLLHKRLSLPCTQRTLSGPYLLTDFTPKEPLPMFEYLMPRVMER